MNEKLVSIEDINLGVLVVKIDDEYTVNVCDADYARCPMCESPNITYGEPDPDGIFIYRIHACDECGTTWEERYDLVRVTINPGKLKIIEEG
jgi:hypothetical protein